MTFRLLLIALSTLLLLPSGAATRQKLPARSRLVKETIVNVFRLTGVKTRDELMAAVQPLLFILAQTDDADTSSVLADLTSYNLGEANDEIFRCVVVRRGITDSKLFTLLRSSSRDDCHRELGKDSDLCRSTGDWKDYRELVRRSIKARESCEIEY
jgi:hypothetical protein